MKILIYILITFAFTNERGWTHPETGWEIKTGSHMCVFSLNNIYINDNNATYNQTDAIGVFFQNQCLGWAYYTDSMTLITAIGNNGEQPEYPSNNDEIDFYLYDESEDLILKLQSVTNLPLWSNGGWHSMPDMYACSFNAPINLNGICPQNCQLDINQDLNIDILDIILLVDATLSSTDSNLLCGDIVDDNEINIIDIFTLLEIITYE